MALPEQLVETPAISQAGHLVSETYVAKTMPSILGTFDMVAIYLAAIFFIGNAALVAAMGSVVSLTYLAIGAVCFFLPSVIANAQLGSLCPHEGSLYNWTSRALGPYWGFFAGVSFWLPNVLAIVGAADGLITYIQGLNNAWLSQPWQQGLVILAIIAFTTLLAIQRQRTTQHIVRVVIALTLGVVVLVAAAGALSLLQHGSRTAMNTPGAWAVNGQNFSLFGFIALLYLGTSVPMNMAGEVTQRSVITRHLLWGTLLVIGSYLICTFALLVARGPALASDPFVPYEVVVLLDSTFGRIVGSLAAVCILCFYLISSLVYNYSTARLLLVASIDRHIPSFLGRLNKHRVPANAILFQSLVAGGFVVVIFFLAPMVATLGKPSDLATEVYNVILAVMTLILALNTLFYFVDLLILLRRQPWGFAQHRVLPGWLIWLSIVVGPITCLAVVVNTLQNSWIPQLIANDRWWLLVGGITLLSLLLAAIASLFAIGQAAWESISR